MIHDSETNFLYLADSLQKKKYSAFLALFDKVLKENNIHYKFLSNTKDIWAVDYMPIQVQKEKFIQFTYYPDYLRDYKTWVKTITNTTDVCKAIGIIPIISDILIDGGNIIKTKSKVIMTSKIFKENNHYSGNKLINEIEKLLELELVIIPLEPGDWLGHSDGTVRFFNEKTVLINDYSKETDLYYIELQMALRNAGLDIIEFPYKKPKGDEAIGLYLNYLQMEDKIFMPCFDIDKDESAIKVFENLFRGHKIIPVLSNDIAKDGGVLNCITWNIYVNKQPSI